MFPSHSEQLLIDESPDCLHLLHHLHPQLLILFEMRIFQLKQSGHNVMYVRSRKSLSINDLYCAPLSTVEVPNNLSEA